MENGGASGSCHPTALPAGCLGAAEPVAPGGGAATAPSRGAVKFPGAAHRAAMDAALAARPVLARWSKPSAEEIIR